MDPACLFQCWCSLDAINANWCTWVGKGQLLLIICADVRQEERACCCRLSWNKTWIHCFESEFSQHSTEWCYTTSNRRRNYSVCHQQEKSWQGQWYCGMRKVLLVWPPHSGDSSILFQLYWNIMKSDCLLLGSSSHKKNHMCCSSMTMPDCAQLCAPLRPSPNLDGHLLDLCYGSYLIAVEFYLLIPVKDRMQGCYYGDVKAL